MISNFLGSLFVLSITSLTVAQFGGVGSGCYSNLNCGGGSICQNQFCVCPYNSVSYGGSCYGGSGFTWPYGGGGYSGFNLFIVQPGGSCSGNLGSGYCGGGSYCSGSGYCSCPQNTAAYGSYCQQINTVYPGQICNTYNQCGGGSFCQNQNNICGCPSGFMGTSNGCIGGSFGNFFGGNYGSGIVQVTVNPGQSCGINAGSYCVGGSSCNQGYCTCPPNCVVLNNQCTPFGGIGGFCNQQAQCGFNAQCMNNQCQCSSGYYRQGGGCYRRKFYRAEAYQKGATK